MDIYDQIIKDGWGFVNLGRHLGLYYAPRACLSNCPKGWLFIVVEDNFTSAQIKEFCVEFMSVSVIVKGEG